MDIVVSGRNVEVPDHYRAHVAEKLSRIEKFDHKLIRIDVELQHERNRRQSSACQHVEITCKSRGPVIRAEACEGDFYSALDAAVNRLESRLRKAADRRRVHYGHRRRPSVSDAVERVEAAPVEALDPAARVEDAGFGAQPPAAHAADRAVSSASFEDDGPGRIVRYKDHTAAPMSIDQALLEMELVGHDFYLFADSETGLASVVYRRKGYDYGVIRLTGQAASPEAASSDAASPEAASEDAASPEAASEDAGATDLGTDRVAATAAGSERGRSSDRQDDRALAGRH